MRFGVVGLAYGLSVAGRASSHSPLLAESVSEVEMGGGVVRPVPKGFLEVVDRFVEAPQLHEGGARAVMRFGKAWLEVERLPQTGDRRRRILLVQKDRSETAVSVRMIGFELHGPLKTRGRLVEFPLQLQGDCQAVVCPGVIGLDSKACWNVSMASVCFPWIVYSMARSMSASAKSGSIRSAAWK